MTPKSEGLTRKAALLLMLHIHYRLVWVLLHAVFTQDPASIWYPLILWQRKMTSWLSICWLLKLLFRKGSSSHLSLAKQVTWLSLLSMDKDVLPSHWEVSKHLPWVWRSASGQSVNEVFPCNHIKAWWVRRIRWEVREKNIFL